MAVSKSHPRWSFFIPAAARLQPWQELYRKVAGELQVHEKMKLKCSGALLVCLMQSRDLIQQLTEIYTKRMLNTTFCFTKYLGMQICCEKVHMARYFHKIQPLLQSKVLEVNIPETFVLPEDYVALERWFGTGKKTVICKPEEGSQGDGIFIAQRFRDVVMKMNGKSGVLQKYITKPLLLGGLKFDFRIYVCILGNFQGETHHVRAFLCKEGLARFCTKKYAEVSAGGTTSDTLLGHLTNYSLNKRSSEFVHGDVHIASKRTLSVALKQIQEEYPDFSIDDFWDSLSELVAAWVAATLPVLEATYEAQNRELQQGARGGESPSLDDFNIGFSQILGFDVLLGRRFKLHLLEVNNSPSLSLDEVFPDPAGTCVCMDHHSKHRHQHAEVDVEVKSIVGRGLLQLIMGKEDEFISEWFIEMEDLHNQALNLLGSLQRRFMRKFGTNNIYAGSNLRKLFSSVLDSSFTTADLDLIATKLKYANQYYVDGSVGSYAMKELGDLVSLLDVVREKKKSESILAVMQMLLS